MGMRPTVVFFRGRNTAGIMRDAASLCEGREVVIVCRKGDDLAEPGDLPVGEVVRALKGSDDIVVVANGGTTAQQVPTVFRLSQFAFLSKANVTFVEVPREGRVNCLSSTLWDED